MAGQNAIVDAIQGGVKNAQADYNHASSSLLCWGPEYFMVSHIFQSLFHTIQADSLTLEHDYRDLLKKNPPRGRKVKELRKRGKLDIILWYSNTTNLRGFIEAKRYAGKSKRDIPRVCYMLKYGGQFGALISGIYQSYDSSGSNVTQASHKAEEKLKQRLMQIENDVRCWITKHYADFTVTLIDHRILKIPLEPNECKSWIWRPVCFIIEWK